MKFLAIQTLLFFVLFFSVERFCHQKTHGFRIHKIQSTLPHNPEWDIAFPTNELENIQAILSQPFCFLDSGGESYVFLSQDKKYILKFFKLHHMRPYSWEDSFLPKKIRTHYQNLRKKRLSTLFSSCKLAYDRFQEDAGLLYIHLNKTDFLKVKLKLFDPIGVLHLLDLDHMEFALQKRATLAYPSLVALSEANEFEAAQKRLSSLLDLILARCQAGLADHDARSRNFGFVGEKAIELDLGSFSIDESLKTSAAAKRVFLHETVKLRCFVKKYAPELAGFLEENINQRLSENL